MKKTLLVLSCIAFMAACGNNKSEYGQYYEGGGKKDSAGGAAVSAVSRNTEVDTSINNIGTDRSMESGKGTAAATGSENYEEGKKLIAQSDCLACHNENDKLVGPAYVAVAEKYQANDKDINYLVSKIKEGGKGVWGEVPMTPHPDLSEDDAKEMVKYILSLKK